VIGDVEEFVADDLLAVRRDRAAKPSRGADRDAHLREALRVHPPPPHTRVKDLPGLALLGTIRSLETKRVRGAIERTFSSRHVQPVQAPLPPPPEAWAEPYARVADLDDLIRLTHRDVEAAARAFLDPNLGGSEVQHWDPAAWGWKQLAEAPAVTSRPT